ncbi:MAG: hypothetical protein IPM18_01255 [Phycisphaerales bacterium]|nr:hypothetical protein [Phycisphaerales bacterium]
MTSRYGEGLTATPAMAARELGGSWSRLRWERGGDFALLLGVFCFGLSVGVALDVVSVTRTEEDMRLEAMELPPALVEWRARDAAGQMEESITTPAAIHVRRTETDHWRSGRPARVLLADRGETVLVSGRNPGGMVPGADAGETFSSAAPPSGGSVPVSRHLAW